MPLDERRNGEASGKIDALRRFTGKPLDLGVRAYSQDAIATHRDRLRVRFGGIHRDDVAVDENEIGALLRQG